MSDPNYRHRTTGQLGRLVHVDGKPVIRLDRNQEEIDVPFSGQWEPETETRKLNRFHAAMISFVADRALCAAQGLGDQARIDWLSMDIEMRQAWEKKGPGKGANELRRELFEVIQKALHDHVLRD